MSNEQPLNGSNNKQGEMIVVFKKPPERGGGRMDFTSNHLEQRVTTTVVKFNGFRQKMTSPLILNG